MKNSIVCVCPNCDCHSRSEGKNSGFFIGPGAGGAGGLGGSGAVNPREQWEMEYDQKFKMCDRCDEEPTIKSFIKSLLQKNTTETAERVVGYIEKFCPADVMDSKYYISKEVLERARKL